MKNLYLELTNYLLYVTTRHTPKGAKGHQRTPKGNIQIQTMARNTIFHNIFLSVHLPIGAHMIANVKWKGIVEEYSNADDRTEERKMAMERNSSLHE